MGRTPKTRNRAPRARFDLESVGINMLIRAGEKKVVCMPQRRGKRGVCKVVLCGESFYEGRLGGRSLKLKGRKEQRFVTTRTRLVGDPHMETQLELAVPREYIGQGEKFIAQNRSSSFNLLAQWALGFNLSRNIPGICLD